MIIIILTASYIGDDVRIVCALANTMRSFSVTDGRTNKAILGVGHVSMIHIYTLLDHPMMYVCLMHIFLILIHVAMMHIYMMHDACIYT